MTDPVIAAQALAGIAPFRLVDARDEAAFAAGHPAHAVRAPLEAWIAAAKTPATFFDNHGFWQQALEDLGLDKTTPAVVYDDGRMVEAARVWFVLQYFGAKAYLLDGGWPALRDADTSGATAPRPDAPRLVALAGSGPIGLAVREELRERLDEVQVLDARTEAEYAGRDLKANKRGGHLPGATLVPHAELLQGGFFLPADQLRRRLDEAGVQDGRPVVAHCDGGGRAALAAIAALRAGYRDVHTYYLSFADWAADESCPIHTP